jgi:hypothetical protein
MSPKPVIQPRRKPFKQFINHLAIVIDKINNNQLITINNTQTFGL